VAVVSSSIEDSWPEEVVSVEALAVEP